MAKVNGEPLRVNAELLTSLRNQADIAEIDEPLLMVRIGGYGGKVHAVRSLLTDSTRNPSVVLLLVDEAGADSALMASGWRPQ